MLGLKSQVADIDRRLTFIIQELLNLGLVPSNEVYLPEPPDFVRDYSTQIRLGQDAAGGYEVIIDRDGITAGDGEVVIDSEGITILGVASPGGINSITWEADTGEIGGAIVSYYSYSLGVKHGRMNIYAGANPFVALSQVDKSTMVLACLAYEDPPSFNADQPAITMVGYKDGDGPGTIMINAYGDDVDTSIKSDNEPYMFYVDASNDRIGIKTNTPERGVEIYDEVNYGPYLQITSKYEGVGSSGIVLRKERVTNDYPNDDDRIGALLFSALDTGGTERFPVAIEIFANGSAGADYVPGRIEFSVTNTSGITTDTMQIGNGVTVGAATGGDKGGGTINVSGNIYKNNTAYTNPDYVLEEWVEGEIVKYKDNPRAKDYVPMDIYEIRRHILEHYRLPGVTDDPAGIFDMADIALELIERLFTITIEQQFQIDELKGGSNGNTSNPDCC